MEKDSLSYEVQFDKYYTDQWLHDSSYQAKDLLLDIAYPYSIKMNLDRDTRWLELGVGTGRVPDFWKGELNGGFCVGLDWSYDGVNKMKRTLDFNANPIVGDIKNLPFPAESFDLITLFGTLQAYPKDQWGEGLKYVHRHLDAGGKMGFSLHPRSFLELIRSVFAWRLFFQLLGNTVTEQDLKELLNRHGFKYFRIERHRSYTALMRLSSLFGQKLVNWFGFIELENNLSNKKLVRLFDKYLSWLTFGHYWVWIEKR